MSDNANPILWSPTTGQIDSSNMSAFMHLVSRESNLAINSYDQLWNWSVEHYESFWELMWSYSGLVHSQSFNKTISEKKMYGVEWFEGARLNFAENHLRFNDDHAAIIGLDESGHSRSLTYAELQKQVAACAAGLRKLGVKQGDRVAAMITNIPEAIIAMLATTSIGAIWSSCSPDFGINGVLSRFGQIEPKVLLTVGGYDYNGKRIDLSERLRQIVSQIESIEQLIFVDKIPDTVLDTNAIDWTALTIEKEAELVFEQLPFDHPVYIMYSSGTTGVPKCIVHGAGGTLLQHYKEHALHTDLKRDDIITYFTTCGWMMWNWLVGALQIGATVIVYDGSPSYPDLNVLWKAVERLGITVFGTSPKFLSSCQKSGISPKEDCKLESLRTILSTGAPLSGENFDYVYSEVKKNLQLASISGGTDIVSCFMLGNPILPVRRSEIQCRGLGMKVETFDSEGNPIKNQVGELVCTAPFVSRPIYFWNDPDNNKLREAYFETYPGIWRHGDYIKILDHGGVIVYGRSDATLNPGGVRIGTAEIYSTVETLAEISDSIVIGQQWRNDTRIVLFVTLTGGIELTEELQQKIRTTIRAANSPRHVPAKIVAVNEIPHTINGKKVELAVTSIIHGRPVKNKDALANPNALEQFANIPELQEP